MNRTFGHGGTILSIAREMNLRPEEIIDFSASINPLGISAKVMDSVATALALAGHYPEASSPALCQALSDYHSLTPENIAVANGSTELIHLIPRLFRRASGRALLIVPTFSEYANSLELAGWKYDYLALSHENGFALDCDEVADELAKGYDLLFFCNPGNPTGKLYSFDDIETLYRLCRSCSCFFVLDEAFIDFAEGASAKHLLTTSDSGMILRSMTKFFGFPGIRVGYSIASPGVTSRIRRFLPPWNLGVIPQAAAVAAMADSSHSSLTLELIEKERSFMTAEFAAIDGLTTFESAANYLLIRIDREISSGSLRDRLLKDRILIRDCSNFEGLDSRFFRVAVKNRGENKKLMQAIARALAFGESKD